MARINITGVSDSRSAAAAGKLINEKGGQWLVVTETYTTAVDMAADLSFFVDKRIFLMPKEEHFLVVYEARSRENLLQRLEIIKTLARGVECVVVASAGSLTKKLPPKDVFLKAALSLSVGEEIFLEETMGNLVDMGYERVSKIYGQGQFAVRGDIVDIFTPYDQLPVRLELFDTEIESMRSFDPVTQRSIHKMDAMEIFPAALLIRQEEAFERAKKKICRQYKSVPKRCQQLLDNIEQMTNLQNLEAYMEYFYPDAAMLWDYLAADGKVIVNDPNRCREYLQVLSQEFDADFEVYQEQQRVTAQDHKIGIFTEALDTLFQDRSKSGIWFLTLFPRSIKGVDSLDRLENFQTRQVLSYNGRMDMLKTDLQRYVKDGYKVYIVCAGQERTKNMEEFLSREQLAGVVWVVTGTLSAGMELVDQKKCYITDNDIFGFPKKIRKKRKTSSKNASPIKAFSEIKEGDFVVHENHGIGKYMGLEQLQVAGETRDYLKVTYAGNDVLYVPAEQMDLIQKYIGTDSAKPKVNKLAGSDWRITKAKARASVAEMAGDLLEISAARKAAGGFAFPDDTPWQKEFEEKFPYEETPDQLRSIEEIKEDMEKPEAMDRLLCGDVGYGKTEVAARAIFKCVTEGKQAAVLVPTTVLASQHYQTLLDRFADFPITIGLLSRFRTVGEQKKTIEELKNGQVDIVIGTHRLLSKDVRFKDLGLLVVDEEQRFGVAHKEKIKQVKKGVDVLTLSATPIPRTLHMSLLGIRNMSLLEEPPEGRYPVQTYVMEEDDALIREIINREMDRGGQVFVIHNRIHEIDRITKKIRQLVPKARVAAGHGRMGETQLEDVIMNFINGQSDVLVATTIVENGIDIPNANTVIVLDADYFGLSQLYQIRGRVGRSGRIAYAYLMHRPGKIMSQIAEKRLRAIKDFTEFGAGFKIAMKDLEIRGAGNLLGSQQHGHMVNVGYELYCRMVDEAVRALKGERVHTEREEVTLDIRLTAYIPDRYIEDEQNKLEMYQRIAQISSDAQQQDVEGELEDRYGAIPIETKNLILISRIRWLADQLSVQKVSVEGPENNILRLVFREGISPRSQRLYLHTRGDHLREIITILTDLKEMTRQREEQRKLAKENESRKNQGDKSKGENEGTARKVASLTKGTGSRYAGVKFSKK